MFELRLKPSELSVIENRTHYIYRNSLKEACKEDYQIEIPYIFSSFSSFNILHRLIISLVNPTLNKVYRLFRWSTLKKRLEKFEILEELEILEIRLSINTTSYHNISENYSVSH